MSDALPQKTSTTPIPANETARLAALYRYKILDTPPEAAFDRITKLAARLFNMPIALISLVDESRAWFKSCVGFDASEVPRDDTLCSFAVLTDEPLVIPDARLDDRFACNPFVQSEPGVRFYAGAPLLSRDGFNLGTLCLLDGQPRDSFTSEQEATLVDLAAMVVDELELRLAAHKIAQIDAALLEITQDISAVTGNAFFTALVQHLTKALGMNYACISLLGEQPEMLKTIAFCASGQLLDNVEYKMQNTPCLEVLQQGKLCCYPHGIQELFPKDDFLALLDIESYAAIPFLDSTGKPLGLLSVMDSKPLEHQQFTQSLLTILAVRIAAELERQQTAERLQLYADVVHNAQIGVVVWQLEDLDDPGSFRLLTANPAASEVTGFNFEPLIGKTMQEGFPLLLQTPLVQQYMQVVRGGQALDLGEVSYGEDGIAAGIYSLKAFPLPNHGLGLVFENITTRKHTEIQLRESQRYSERIAETLPGILFVHDIIEQRNVYTNRQITDLLGYTSEQVQAMGTEALPTLIHPDDLKQVFSYFEDFRFASEGAVLGIEYRARHANGEWRSMYSQCVVFNRTAEGLPHQILGVSIDITDRKQAEAALVGQEQRYRYIFEAVGISIWEEDFSEVKAAIDQLKAAGIQDFRQYFTHHPEFVQQAVGMVHLRNVNQASLKLFGAQNKAELLSSLHQIFTPETHETFIEELLALADAKTHFAAETILQTLQGNRIHIWFTITFPPPSDPYDHVLVSLVDVTDRKQIEAALRDSEERLRTLTATIPQLIWTATPEGRVDYLSEQWADYIGLPPERLYDWNWQQVVHPEDLPNTLRDWAHSLQTGEPLEIQHRFRYRTGEWRWQLVRGNPIKNAIGQVTKWAGTCTDIQSEVDTKTALQASEEQSRSILARERHYMNQLQGLTTAALAINTALSIEEVLQVITNQAASIIGAHQSVTSMTINQNWAQAINAVYLSEKYAQWRDYDEPTDGSGIYGWVCHANRPVRMTQAELEAHPGWKAFGDALDKHPPMRGWLAAPLIGRDGHNIGLIQLSDKYEGEFTEADESILVQLAQMASVAVENARLYEAEQQARATAEAAREEAQAANRVKDEFLAVLSHELRSPLNPILGWAKLLRSGNLNSAKTAQALATIERNAKLQSELIEDLLDVSRILQGKLSLNASPVNLVATIQAAIETVRLAAEVKSITVEAYLNPLIETVLGDSTRLQQVVWNLLSNAVKFTPAGGRVEVELAKADDQAQITVRDTGKGIPADFLPYVFDYFRQEDSATTRQFGGLGLGLAIVRHMVELHGGTVQVESSGEGLGATFTVKLPLLEHREWKKESRENNANASLPAPHSPLADLQILVIDDETDSREFVAFVLEQAGASVTTASTAAEGFSALTQSPPDLLLSDIGMPDMDGYMLMRQVRALPLAQGGQVKAIALTAYAGDFNQQQALQAGFQRHLAKPIEPQALIQEITTLIHGRGDNHGSNSTR